jgi:hypothetical protein
VWEWIAQQEWIGYLLFIGFVAFFAAFLSKRPNHEKAAERKLRKLIRTMGPKEREALKGWLGSSNDPKGPADPSALYAAHGEKFVKRAEYRFSSAFVFADDIPYSVFYAVACRMLGVTPVP